MASYLNEVLTSANEVELGKIKTTLKSLDSKIAELKKSVISIMENKFVEFEPIRNENIFLVSNTKKIISEIQSLQDSIENQTKRNLTHSTEELKTLSEDLQEKTITIKIIDELNEIDNAFEEAHSAQSLEKYVDAAKALNLIEEKVIDKNKDIEYLHIFKGIRSELIHCRSGHLGELLLKWEKCIKWSVFEMDKNKQIMLTIDAESCQECVTALHYHQSLILELKKFAEKFLKDILYKIISSHCKVTIESETSLNVISNNTNKSLDTVKTLKDLTVAFKFVDSMFRVNLGEETSVMVLLGKIISKDFSEFLINHCLKKAVPLKLNDLESYKDVAEEIIQFNLLLSEIGFFEENNNAIISYTDNLEILLVNKMCQNYLVLARDIMKKDLYNMVEVGHEVSEEEHLKDTTINLSELTNSLFLFPKCQISSSVNELIILIEDILINSRQSNGTLSKILFTTARNIFKMYCNIVPEYHKQNINFMPQKSALIHNNCMFLAHKLPMLGIILENQNVPGLKPCTITFIDIINDLRCVAVKVMQDELRSQRRRLIQEISECDIFHSKCTGSNKIQAPVDNCFEHLAALKTTWHHILPFNSYCKLIGLLCNAVLEEIYQKVSSAKDISQEILKYLVPLLVLVRRKILTIFSEPKEIQQYVKNWKKFCDLVELQESRLLG